MSTTTFPQTESANRPSALQRIVNVSRLHVVNKGQIIVVPWLIMGFIFLLMIAITGVLRMSLAPSDLANTDGGFQYYGGTSFFFIYMMVVAIMAINKTFPFAQGYSVTRRDFFLGSSLAFVGLSAAYALALALLGWIEQTTQGWGISVTLFATASVYVRWAVNGMLIFFATVTVLLVGVLALITLNGGWGRLAPGCS